MEVCKFLCCSGHCHVNGLRGSLSQANPSHSRQIERKLDLNLFGQDNNQTNQTVWISFCSSSGDNQSQRQCSHFVKEKK